MISMYTELHSMIVISPQLTTCKSERECDNNSTCTYEGTTCEVQCVSNSIVIVITVTSFPGHQRKVWE